MSLEEYGIDRYKISKLFKNNVGPKGADGDSLDGSSQIIIRERVENSITNATVNSDILVHTISAAELNYGESIQVLLHVRGVGVAFPVSTFNLRWQRAAPAVDVSLTTVAAVPVNGVTLVEMQVDPWNNNYMYFTANPGHIWTTNRGRVNIGEDWLANGGQFVVRITVAAGATVACTAIYMLKKS